MSTFFSRIQFMKTFIQGQNTSKLKQTFSRFFKQLNHNFKPISRLDSPKKRVGITTSLAACGLFSWDEFRISNDEVTIEIKDILDQFNLDAKSQSERIDFEASRSFENKEWSKIYDKNDLIIWRRTIGYDEENQLDIFEHKVLGRIDDITPIEYFKTQLNLDYRKEWDHFVKFLEMIKQDPVSKTELVQWVSKFPYPLSDREYMFVRRYCIEPKEKLLVLLSRGLPELTDLPFDKKTVKVTQYKSNMIIVPYTDFDKPGIFYIIQYYDVNKAKIPRMAMKWMASSGLPDYVNKLHKATLKTRNQNPNDSDNNSLEPYEVFSMNSSAVQTSSSDIDRTSAESEVNLYDTKVDLKEKDSALVTSKTMISSDNCQNKNEDLNDIMPGFLIEVTRKLNEDYFNEYEPHPIFFNY